MTVSSDTALIGNALRYVKSICRIATLALLIHALPHIATAQESDLKRRANPNNWIFKKCTGMGCEMTLMVRIPAGEFRMGSKEGQPNEKPPHSVYLDEYLIDIYETTVADYKKCVEAGKCDRPKTGRYYNWRKTGRDRHPINGVDWFNAKKYCEYVGKRLPTEAEWERTASWRDGKKYKYSSGKSSVSCTDAVMDDGNKYGGSDADGCGKDCTWKVGSKPEEINGTYDMAGNVWEWVLDWYDSDYYDQSPRSNPKGPDSGSSRVLRGGGWGYAASGLRGANRSYGDPSLRVSGFGFRCAVSP